MKVIWFVLETGYRWEDVPLRKAGVLEAELAVIDSVLVRVFGGGDATGPSPVARRQLWSKRMRWVDANGVPLVIRTAPANASDYKLMLPVVERTISWFKGLRRLRIRYYRSDHVQDAWNRLAASVLCYRVAIRWGICTGYFFSGPIRLDWRHSFP